MHLAMVHLDPDPRVFIFNIGLKGGLQPKILGCCPWPNVTALVRPFPAWLDAHLMGVACTPWQQNNRPGAGRAGTSGPCWWWMVVPSATRCAGSSTSVLAMGVIFGAGATCVGISF